MNVLTRCGLIAAVLATWMFIVPSPADAQSAVRPPSVAVSAPDVLAIYTAKGGDSPGCTSTIEELPGGALQGYSAALDLRLRWAAQQLAFYDPATGRPITTLESERARAEAAEARVRELEAELRRWRGG